MAKKSLAERFWAKVDRRGPDECWPFLGAKRGKGYGGIKGEDGRLRSAHVVAFELQNGPLPPRLHALHTCDHRRCVNGAHLFAGTNAVNMADRNAKGRQARGSRHGKSRLTEAQAAQVLELKGLERQRITAERFGVAISTVGNIQAGWTRGEPRRRRS